MFFGLRADIEVAHYLTELVDTAVRTETGRFKTSREYQKFRHNERHLANSSFSLGMVASIADKLMAMKAERDHVGETTGRALVMVKASVVEAEFAKLDMNLKTSRGGRRMVSMTAYEAGGVAGASLAIHPGIGAGNPGTSAYRTAEVPDVVTITGLPALMTLAVWVAPSWLPLRAATPNPARAIPATTAIATIFRCVERSAL